MAYILMIDDNPQNQRYLERIIRHRSSHEIEFAESSDSGIEKMVERRPDVILLDLFIPVKSQGCWSNGIGDGSPRAVQAAQVSMRLCG